MLTTRVQAAAQDRTGSNCKGNAFQRTDSRTVFLLGLLIADSGIVSPPVALGGGIAFGFAVEHPLRTESTKLLLQASVVALGFGMNLAEVVHAGRSGFLYTAVSITFAMGLGWHWGSGCGWAMRQVT